MILIGIDDTDNADSPGTGRLARELSEHLQAHGLSVYGITRHQLLVDPRIPYTAKNSSAALHLAAGEAVDLEWLTEVSAAFVAPRTAPGSDPAVCVARAEALSEAAAFGRRAQTEVVTQAEARDIAGRCGIALRGLGGTEGGVIGALAGAGLASSGEDGRFILIGGIRRLSGMQPVSAIVGAGVGQVRRLDGRPLDEGLVLADKLRPNLRGGQAVLYVEDAGDYWRPVRFD